VVAFAVGLPVLVVCLAWLTRSSWLPHAIAAAPNAGRSIQELAGQSSRAGTTHDVRIDVGPPRASLALDVIEPEHALPRGTIFVLHGIRDSKASMVGVGESFADAGYRAVLVDQRGQGQSTGDWLTFGDQEGRDLVQVGDALAADGMLAQPVGVYGPSYGGASALQFARRDPRVRAVVTVATFTRMRDVVPLYGERVVPSWFITRSDMNRAIDRVGELAHFDPDGSDSVVAIAATQAHVLLVHGRADANIPWQHAQILHAAAPDHSRLWLVDGRNHSTIMGDASVIRESVAWFARWLDGS
jgi:pimeloyl-ACP methyl ester carboxylesterase